MAGFAIESLMSMIADGDLDNISISVINVIKEYARLKENGEQIAGSGSEWLGLLFENSSEWGANGGYPGHGGLVSWGENLSQRDLELVIKGLTYAENDFNLLGGSVAPGMFLMPYIRDKPSLKSWLSENSSNTHMGGK